MKPQIVNIVNFIRAVEPRDRDLDLYEPVRRQIGLLNRYDLPGTFLLQYDALLDAGYVRLLGEEANDKCEIGAWLEIMQPLVEKAGLAWRGRPGFAWDWHAHVGFSVGYMPSEREKLVDVFMEDFRKIFGRYPESVGSWLIDAHTLAYLADRYGIAASCNCKDQWGTDGYTLWGGYYNQAYYPSRKNVFTPAQSERNTIPVPVFRMLGSDPIYQYDMGLLDRKEMEASSSQAVVTLEPVYSGTGGGGSPDWVRWYFRENFSGLCLSFGYTQAGQENSFGWKAMRAGLTDQIGLIAQKAAAGELRVETLRDSGKWYRANYKQTPASVVAALSDWKDRGVKSFWYSSRFYRVNLYQSGDRVWIRDLHCFDELYEERYLNRVCDREYLVYDNLPVMDGNRWSGHGIRAGIYPVEILSDPVRGEDRRLSGNDMRELLLGEPDVREINADELSVTWPVRGGDVFTVLCSPDRMTIGLSACREGMQWGMRMLWDGKKTVPIEKISKSTIYYRHNGHPYVLRATQGLFHKSGVQYPIVLLPDNNSITLHMEPGAGMYIEHEKETT